VWGWRSWCGREAPPDTGLGDDARTWVKKAHGNVVDHEYAIERDGETVAAISKKWFRLRDSYGVDVPAGEDAPLILAITVAIDSLTTRD
jgi:uncharacterized protein YxjI